MSEVITPAEPRKCPYFGLDYYREEFGAWFFGREVEGDKIITNLQASRLTLLHAESGVGKSSLLRAGVAWRLRELALAQSPPSGAVVDLPVVFSSWKDDPVRELIGEIRAATEPFLAGRPAPDPRHERLDTAIEAAAEAADASLMVILDQFEEYFLYCSREGTPEHFADELARCINRAEVPANFLISIREDAYAGLGDLFKGRIANVYGNYLHIDYLDRELAEQAIREPLEVYNRQPGVEPVTIQDQLVEAVLNQVPAYGTGGDSAGGRAAANGGGGRIATPLLQLVMETVWQREVPLGSRELRLSTLQSLEGVEKIVDTHLGNALRALDSGERQTAIDMFDHLVTPSGGKIAESVPYLAQRTGHNEQQVAAVLGKLDHERIVRPVPASPGQDPMRFRRYEIFHDVLAPAINNAIAAREAQRRARRLQRLAGLAVCLLIAAVALGGFFVYLWHRAATEQQIAESRQLAAAATAELPRDPQMSALLALHALHVHDTSQAEAALRAALPDIQEVRAFSQKGTALSWAAFDPANPNEVAGAGLNGSVWIWDVKTGRQVAELSPHARFGAANAVAFNARGTQVVVGYEDGKVAVFNVAGGRPQRVVNVGPVVNSVKFVGSADILAIATARGAGLWAPGGPCCYVLYRGQANTIAVDQRDPLEFAVATSSGTRVWKLGYSSGRPVWRKVLRQGQTTSSLAVSKALLDHDAEFSPNGQDVVTADADGVVRVYDVATTKLVATLNAGLGLGEPESVAYSPPDGKLIVAGYSDGATLVWDAATHVQRAQLTGNEGTVVEAEFSPNGRDVVTASKDGVVRVWQVQPPELQAAFSDLPSTIPLYAGEYSPDGRQILTVDSAGFANVFTTDGSLVGFAYPLFGGGVVSSAQFNRTGTEIVTADTDGRVDLWRVHKVEFPQVPHSPPIQLSGSARYAAFSPTGSRILVVTNNATAEVVSTQTGQVLYTLNPRSLFQLAMARFSPDGSQILTAGENGQVEVWDAATGRELRVLGRQGPGINDVEFDRSGGMFVTVSADGVVTTWAARSDRRLRSFATCPAPSTAALSPGGRLVVIACTNGTAPVFSTATGQQMTVLTDPGTVTGAAFSPDGKSIVTTFAAGSVGGVRIWSSHLATLPLSSLRRLATAWVTPDFPPSELRAADVTPSRSSAP